MFFQKIIVGMMDVNCYLVGSCESKKAAIIDPGDDYSKIKKVIDKFKLIPQFIINTHGHMDHIGADDKFNLPVYIHKLDKECLINPERNLSAMFGQGYSIKPQKVRALEGGDIVRIDDLNLKVIHTPGHTAGSICLKADNIIFTGDTLFLGGVGRTDFPGSSDEDLFRSIKEKLLVLDDETVIYPGHGPESTIGKEKKRNPFLQI